MAMTMAHLTTVPHQKCSASPSVSSYEVFINFCGQDVEYSFVRKFCYDLFCCGLRAFLNTLMVQSSGFGPSTETQTAIRDACVHIAIFSPNYAQSKRCLDELVIIANSGVTILPVFYNVKPSELRWTGKDKHGGYADGLRSHEVNQQTIQSWRDALNHVAGISGFELEACDSEDDLLNKVVQSVRKAVPKTRLDAAKYLTGLGQNIEELEEFVRSQHKGRVEAASIVGIVGVSGVGKTTVANAFLNLKSSDYDGTSFLYDVKESAERMSLNSLQTQLIKDLRHIDDIKIGECEEGVGILKKNLWSCHALIVLDNVHDLDQLDAFLPIKSVLHPKSLILVTSRDKHLLTRAGIAESSIYHVEKLNREYSKALFCWHAFFQPHPPPGLVNDVDRVLKACDGLPLPLKVWGAYFCVGKTNIPPEYYCTWPSPLLDPTFDAHQIIFDVSCFRLSPKIVYDKLSVEEQQIFLDIAYFFIGKNRDSAIRIWNEKGWNGIRGFRILQIRCMVEVDGENKIRMHDQMRDLARDVMSEDRKYGRSPLRVESITDAITNREIVYGITTTRHPSTLQDVGEARNVYRPVLRRFLLEGLSVIESEGDNVERILRKAVFPERLFWLRWNECPCRAVPSWVPLKLLRVLEVTGTQLKKLWSHRAIPLHLRELKVCTPRSLHFPKGFYHLKDLEKIVVDVPRMTDQDYDVFINHRGPDTKYTVATNLYRRLLLCGLRVFLDKPELRVGHEISSQIEDSIRCASVHIAIFSQNYAQSKWCLDELVLMKQSGAPIIPIFYQVKPHGVQAAGKDEDGAYAEALRIHETKQRYESRKIENWRDALSQVATITGFELSANDENEEHILEQVTQRVLEMIPQREGFQDEGTHPMRLPDEFCNLPSLKHFELTGCYRLLRLPKSFGNLTTLTHINLRGCETLAKLPNSFENLRNLHHLDLSYCKSLKMLSNSLGNMTNLERINLACCISLEMLPNSLGDLTNLKYINLYCCRSLEMLPDSFGNLTNLQNIGLLSGCDSLKNLPDSFGSLTKLQRICMSGSESLESLPNSFGNLINLQRVNLSSCKRLKMLPNSLQNLTKLRHINLSWCESLQVFPNSLLNLTNLQFMKLDCCTSLEMLPDYFGSLENLEHIDLSGCNSLKVLPDSFGNLPQLKHLHLSDCSSLTISTEMLGNITTLECLDLSGCLQMELLPPQIGHQQFLLKLNLLGTNLKEWPSDHVACLSNLELLRIGGPFPEVLPSSFLHLTSLKELWLNNCEKLQCLPDSVGLLCQLTVLNIWNCSVQYLPPDILNMKNLEVLTVGRCPLMELPFTKVEGEMETDWTVGTEASSEGSSSDKGMLQLKELELYRTNISEVSFSKGICPNLEHVKIKFCNALVEVGALPTTLVTLKLKYCSALRKIGGVCAGLAKLERLDMRGCNNIQIENVPTLQTLKSFKKSSSIRLDTFVSEDGQQQRATLKGDPEQAQQRAALKEDPEQAQQRAALKEDAPAKLFCRC